MSATILKLQTFLTSQGFDTGGVDGYDGPKTESAWARYEASVSAPVVVAPVVEPAAPTAPKSTDKESLILRILKATETGRSGGDYSLISIMDDGEYGRTQLTLGIQFDEKSGDLGRVLDLYSHNLGAHATQLNAYRSKVNTFSGSQSVLSQDSTFKSLLKSAGSDPAMQHAQDVIFANETWAPSFKWSQENGFTLALSEWVIADSFIQSGSILPFLRAGFSTVVPAKGGDEKTWITNYVKARHSWLSNNSNTAIRNSAYRTECILANITAGNWNLDRLPINMNGVKVS